MVSGTNNKYSGNEDLILYLTRREEYVIMRIVRGKEEDNESSESYEETDV